MEKYLKEEVKEYKEVEVRISPVGKFKRICLFLGDFFISFILSFLLMNLTITPIGSLFWKVDEDKGIQAERICLDCLYDNNLLFNKENEFKKYNFDSNLRYTYNRWLSYYCFDSGEQINPNYPEYTKKEDNEVIKTFYVNIRKSPNEYLDIFKKENEGKIFFDFANDVISLKPEIINEVRLFCHPVDKLGPKGEQYYSELSDIFSSLYGCVVNNILDKDLLDAKGNSYIDNTHIAKEITNQKYWRLFTFSMISYVLSTLLVYLAYPLINKYNHTPTMSIMKIERLGSDNLKRISKVESSLTVLMNLIFNLIIALIMPLSYMNTTLSIFNVPFLPVFGIISIGLIVVGLFFILINGFNRSLCDVLSRVIMVPSNDYDSIMKAQETVKENNNYLRKKNNG